MRRKSELWTKTATGTEYETEMSTAEMVRDLTFSKTTDLEGHPINANWLLAVDEPDVKVMVARGKSKFPPTVLVYHRKEVE